MSSPDRIRRLQSARERFQEAALAGPALRCFKTGVGRAMDLLSLGDEGIQSALRELLTSLGQVQEEGPLCARVDSNGPVSEALAAFSDEVVRDRIAFGHEDLAIGFPWLEGRIARNDREGEPIRAPLLLFPITLMEEMTSDGELWWTLRLSGPPYLNEALASTFRRLTRVRLTYEDFLAHDEDGIFGADDATWQGIVKTLTRSGITLANTERTLPDQPERFHEETFESLKRYPPGQFRLAYQVVLGRFSLREAAMAADYDAMLGGSVSLSSGEGVILGAGAPLIDVDEEAPGVYGPFPAPQGEDLGVLGPWRRWQVLPSDPWQDEAMRGLEMLRDGGLTIYAPPSAGKSQLITNIIAAAIARGERVLVTSPRRLALDEVAERLADRGLDQAIQVVQDPWRQRAELTQNLSEILAYFAENGTFEPVDLSNSQKRLKMQERSLFSRLDAVDAAYDALAGSDGAFPGLAELDERMLTDETLQEVPLEFACDLTDCVDSLKESDFEYAMRRVDKLFEDAGHFMLPHPYGLRTDWSGFSKQELLEGFQSLQALRDGLRHFQKAGGYLTLQEVETHLGFWEKVQPLFTFLEKGRFEDFEEHGRVRAWMISEGVTGGPNRGCLEWVKRLRHYAKELQALPPVLIMLAPDEIEERIAQLDKLAEMEASKLSALSPAYWQLKKLPAQLVATLPVDYSEIDIPTLRELHEEALRWQEAIHSLPTKPAFRLEVLGRPEMFGEIALRLEKAYALANLEEEVVRTLGPNFPEPPDWLRQPPEQRHDARFFEALFFERDRGNAFRELLRHVGVVEVFFHEKWGKKLAKAVRKDMAAAEAMLAPMLEQKRDAPQAHAVDVAVSRLPVFVKRFMERYEGPWEWAGPMCRRAVEESWRVLRIQSNRDAALLTDPRELRATSQAFLDMEDARAQHIARVWQGRLNELTELESQRQDLLRLVHETSRRRMRASMKHLIERYWKRGLSAIKPIWFIPLEAVSSVFPRERDTFDLVIVDEAQGAGLFSALPALMRTRRVLVIGDPFQAPPPARYFEEPSLFRLARGAYPSSGLWWGWGARFEELVAFANATAYGNMLLVVPNVETLVRPSYQGLHYHQVDGFYDQGINEAEAQAVVKLIAHALMTPDEEGHYPTVSVRALTRQQVSLIWQRLQERAAEQPELRAALERDAGRPEGERILVSELYTRPLDLRDVQILSLTYGTTRDSGRLVFDFGPLDREGGEGYVYGFMTRARVGVMLVCSMSEASIDTSRTRGKGPQLLRAWMAYMRGASTRDERMMHEGIIRARKLIDVEFFQEQRDQDLLMVGDYVRDSLVGELQARSLHVQVEPPRASGVRFGQARTPGAPLPGVMRPGPIPPDLTVTSHARKQPSTAIYTSRYLREPDTILRDIYARRFWQQQGWNLIRVTPGVWRSGHAAIVEALERLFELEPGQVKHIPKAVKNDEPVATHEAWEELRLENDPWEEDIEAAPLLPPDESSWPEIEVDVLSQVQALSQAPVLKEATWGEDEEEEGATRMLRAFDPDALEALAKPLVEAEEEEGATRMLRAFNPEELEAFASPPAPDEEEEGATRMLRAFNPEDEDDGLKATQMLRIPSSDEFKRKSQPRTPALASDLDWSEGEIDEELRWKRSQEPLPKFAEESWGEEPWVDSPQALPPLMERRSEGAGGVEEWFDFPEESEPSGPPDEYFLENPPQRPENAPPSSIELPRQATPKGMAPRERRSVAASSPSPAKPQPPMRGGAAEVAKPTSASAPSKPPLPASNALRGGAPHASAPVRGGAPSLPPAQPARAIVNPRSKSAAAIAEALAAKDEAERKAAAAKAAMEARLEEAKRLEQARLEEARRQEELRLAQAKAEEARRLEEARAAAAAKVEAARQKAAEAKAMAEAKTRAVRSSQVGMPKVDPPAAPATPAPGNAMMPRATRAPVRGGAASTQQPAPTPPAPSQSTGVKVPPPLPASPPNPASPAVRRPSTPRPPTLPNMRKKD